VAKAFNTKEGSGSRTTSTLGTLPKCVSTLKTLPNRHEDRVSKEASSPNSIPLSPSYFDVLSKEENAPPEGNPLKEPEHEFADMHRALALDRFGPKG